MTSMLRTLREELVDSSSHLDEDDFRLRGLWRVDHRSQPNEHERFMVYSFVIAQTIRQGCCYADFGTVVLDENSDALIGQDARKARGRSVAEDIAILDAAWGVLPTPRHRAITFDGTPAQKASTRAALIVDEAIDQLPDRGRGRIANIGVMGNLIHQLQRRADVEITASDFDAELIKEGILGVPVEHGDRSPDLVADCDVALVCGETIANDTLQGLLRVARENDTRIVIFAVSGCHFAAEYCRTFGANVVISEPQPQYLFQGPSTVRVVRREEVM